MSGAAVSGELQIAGVLPVQAVRWGVKGAGASAWLQRCGIAVPGAPNRATHWAQGRCLRLGHSEFLIEQDESDAATPLLPEVAPEDANAWQLLRSDSSVLLSGHHWPAALAQGCSFDFERLRAEPDLVVMTLFAGISVTFVREPGGDASLSLRLWCDASHSTYLDQCLQQIAATVPLETENESRRTP